MRPIDGTWNRPTLGEGRASDWPALAAGTLCSAFVATSREHHSRVALRCGDGMDLTFGDYARRVASVATGLAAHGVGDGDVVALMLANRPEFHVVDTAVLFLRAVPFSVYNSSPAEAVEFAVRDAGARVVVTELAFVDRILDVSGRVPELETVIVVDGVVPGTLSLADVERAGPAPLDLEVAARNVQEDAVAAVIYTSGTSGAAKGVEHTHRSVMSGMASMHSRNPVSPRTRYVSYLPMAHIGERIFSHYSQMVFGHEVTCCADPGAAVATFVHVRPNRLFGVPRMFELMKASLDADTARERDPARRRRRVRALAAGLRRVRALQAGDPVDDALEAECVDAEDVYAEMRARIGLDAVQAVAVGGAAAPTHVLEFFHAIGLPIAEAWGMAEVMMVLGNPPGREKIGTAGIPVPGAEVRLAADGELLVRTPTMFRGYLGKPEATAELFDADGWFSTGDVADLDADGYVTIIGRKSEILINSAGENMSPTKIESAVKEATPLVGQCICVGDDRPFNVALVVLDVDAASAWAFERGRDGASLHELSVDPAVRAEIESAIVRANDRLSAPERVRRFTVLRAQWVPGGAELTPTSKVRRKPVAEKYRAEIEALYAG